MEYYKQTKQKEEELAILEVYINNSEDMHMDCTPLPLTKENINKKE